MYHYSAMNPLRYYDYDGRELTKTKLPRQAGVFYLDDTIAHNVISFLNNCHKRGVDLSAGEHYRTEAYNQKLIYDFDHKKNPNIIKRPAENSLHRAGFAIDIANFNSLSYSDKAIVVEEANRAGLQWGNSFSDPVHFYKEVPKGQKNRMYYIKLADEKYDKFLFEGAIKAAASKCNPHSVNTTQPELLP